MSYSYEFAGIKLPDIKTDTLAHAIAEHFPNVWTRCYTKHYDAPGVYRSFKYVATQFAAGIIYDAEMRVNGGQIVTNMPVLFKILEEYDWPTYHVHGNMIDALRRTHPPSGMTWKDVAMPYTGVIFMTPAGSIRMPRLSNYPGIEDSSLAYVGIARLSRERFKFMSYGAGEGDNGADRMCLFWSADTPDGPVCHDCAFPITQSLEPDAGWINDATLAQEEAGFACEDIVDGAYLSTLAGVVANLLLLRTARPEQVEAGTRTSRTLRTGAPVHTPTFIGRRYVARRDEQPRGTSAGRFTEIGWRAGHMKEQPFGPMRKDRKTIWVEPYMAYTRGLANTTSVEDRGAADGLKTGTAKPE